MFVHVFFLFCDEEGGGGKKRGCLFVFVDKRKRKKQETGRLVDLIGKYFFSWASARTKKDFIFFFSFCKCEVVMTQVVEYDFQTPMYRRPGYQQYIKVDTSNNQLEIADLSDNKIIYVRSNEFANNSGYSLPYVQMYETINACAAAVYPPPNSTTLKLNNTLLFDDGAGTTNTLTIYNIALSASGAGGPTNTLTGGDMTINDDGNINVSQVTPDYVQFSTTGFFSQLTATQLQINDDPQTLIARVHNNNILFQDTTTNIQVELNNDSFVSADPFLRLQNTNGTSNYLYFRELNADSHFNFILNNNQSFFKQMNPFGFQQYELVDGDHIEKYMPFVMIQNGGGATLKLRDPTNYLDDNGLAGWSCIVSNYGGIDLNIDMASAASWYAHSNTGGMGNPITIKKWVTCRLTLVYSSIDSQFIWAVSQF